MDKEGLSVGEIQSYIQKYANVGSIIISLIVAAFSSMLDFFTGPVWTISFLTIATILSILLPTPISKTMAKIYEFLAKQQKIMDIVFGIVRIILAIFVPFIVFIEIGLLAGIAFRNIVKKELS